ncbi:hypothetical protein DXD68_00250 [Parabacteroides sp. TM07-1AC]|uniref:lipopolysaccharide biosynthesis protein n=1 Tax=Parabacteroides sp. TM07-1AC TaxID=2292363 RepID=UPI000F003CFF|nr:polysaccharide biosynthesis C-terminal domain-containing protein [Parabacteroides sp. TM07-1AC]RHU30300.1 hypothetical protein DXD68_00250 [Parabacteroides sp. TM07-1AC]
MQMNLLKGYYQSYYAYIKNASIYLTATIVSSLLAVVINPLLALNLSAEDYATLGYYSGYANLFTPLIGFFIIDYYLRNRYLLKGEDLLKLKSSLLKLLILFSGGSSIICFCILWVYMNTYDASIPFWPFALLKMAQIYTSFVYSFKLADYKIDGNAKGFFKISLIQAVIATILSITFVVVLKWGAFGYMVGQLLVNTIFLGYCLWSYRDVIILRNDTSILNSLIKYSTPLAMAGALGFFANGYDKIYLERNKDLYALGIYAIAFQMSSYLNIFATAIKSTFQPDIFKAIAEKNLRKVVKMITLVVAFVSVVVMLFVLFCPILINILTAGRYDESTDLTRILSLSIITSTIYYQISQVTYGSGLSNITLINKIIGSVLTVLLFSYVIPQYGAQGAAWGTVISYLLFALGNVILLCINKNKFLK